MNYSIKLLALLFVFQFGCKSSEKTSAEKENKINISEVTIEAITRGKRENYSINPKQFSYKSTSKGEQSVEKIKMTIDEDQWEQLEGLVAAINLARINTLEVPSKKFQFDGDLATTLNVNVNDTVYTSSTFDKKNPPEEIAELVVRAGCYALAFAPESGSPEILEDVRKQVDLDNVVEAMRVILKQGMRLSSFFVIGFPNETKETLRQTLSFIRKIALIGVYDVSVTKFVPYPGSALFKQLQRDGLITLDDEFFISPMYFYSRKSESFAAAISSRHLYWMMIWMYVNFYVLSFLRCPLRTFIILSKSIISGTEETRYAKWLVDQLYTRRKWKRIGNQA